MPLQYSCFISYCHGQHELMRRFVDDLKAALRGAIEPYLDAEIYIDEERLSPGYQYNEALASALCRSACMIVIYVPKYAEHEYCVREFAAMEKLEAQRRKALPAVDLRERGMIIPIVLRGTDTVPKRIRQRRHFADFSKYTTASPKITRNRKYAEKVDEIASYIYQLFRDLNAAGDPCVQCNEFGIPSARDAEPLRTDIPDAVYPR